MAPVPPTDRYPVAVMALTAAPVALEAATGGTVSLGALARRPDTGSATAAWREEADRALPSPRVREPLRAAS